MDNRPVGIFDSGLGGLTAVKALRKLLPGENIIYFADSARVPYGTKSLKELKVMTRQNLDFLASFDVKIILAACGTVSSNTADILESYPIKSIGVVKSAVKAMGNIPGSRPLGIIATPASIRGAAFERELRKLYPEREIICGPCPDFVTLIENGHSSTGDSLLNEAVRKYMKPFKDADAAAVLLGCTHFGIISEALRAYLGDSTELVSASVSAAERLADILREKDALGSGGELRCFTSGIPEEFSSLAADFLGEEPESFPRHVPPMEV